MGRCGRVAPGVCVRLYREEDYAIRDRYTPPEIQRTNLASVILQTKALKLGPIEDFPNVGVATGLQVRPPCQIPEEVAGCANAGVDARGRQPPA